MARSREFIAIDIPPQVSAEIASAALKIKKLNFPISFRDPEKAHITLAFLGSLSTDRRLQAAEAAEKAAAETPPFELTTGVIWYFFKDKASTDSVIFLDIVDPNKSLRGFYKKLYKNLAAGGFYPPEKLTPHITIGKLKRPRHRHEQTDMLSKITEIETKPHKITVDSIALYESPQAESQKYHLLRRFPLTK